MSNLLEGIGARKFAIQKETISKCDYIFSGDEVIQKQTIQLIKNNFILPHCFDLHKDVLNRIENSKKNTYDFSFLGHSGASTPDHKIRLALLNYLLATTPLICWLKEVVDPPKSSISIFDTITRIKIKLLKTFTDELGFLPKVFRKLLAKEIDNSCYLRKFHTRLFDYRFGIDYFETISQSKISLNIHVDNLQHGGNIRCYETTGCESCLLTDRKEILKDSFIPDREAVYYSSKEELIQKCKYLLLHEKTRAEIAKKGKARTLKDHNIRNRIDLINQKFSQLLQK